MGRAMGFLGLLLALAIGAYLYTRQAESVSGGAGNPQVAVDTVGVRNDLIELANAERRHFATENKYVSLEELSGDISMVRKNRGFYTYSATVSEIGFRITATYNGPPNPEAPKVISINETMQVTNE